jgi:hypothetical protein
MYKWFSKHVEKIILLLASRKKSLGNNLLAQLVKISEAPSFSALPILFNLYCCLVELCLIKRQFGLKVQFYFPNSRWFKFKLWKKQENKKE